MKNAFGTSKKGFLNSPTIWDYVNLCYVCLCIWKTHIIYFPTQYSSGVCVKWGKAFISVWLLFSDLLLSALITSNSETGGQVNKSVSLRACRLQVVSHWRGTKVKEEDNLDFHIYRFAVCIGTCLCPYKNPFLVCVCGRVWACSCTPDEASLSLYSPLSLSFSVLILSMSPRHQICCLFSENYLLRENKLVQTKPDS